MPDIVGPNRSQIFSRIAAILPSVGRENPHEVVAAARAIGAALKGHGHDWHDLARAIECFGSQPIVFSAPTPPSSTSGSCWSPPTSGTPSFGDMARACRNLDRGRLADREHAFVNDMVRRGFSFRPSPRQSAWLADIFDRLNRRAAA